MNDSTNRMALSLAQQRLDMIAARIEDAVADGEASEQLRDVYLIAIGRKCPWCEAEPGDNEYCVGDGEPHPWVS